MAIHGFQVYIFIIQIPTFMINHEKNSMWWMLYCQTQGFGPCTHLIVKFEKGSLVIDWQTSCPMGACQGVKWPNCSVCFVLLFCQKYINWLSEHVIATATVLIHKIHNLRWSCYCLHLVQLVKNSLQNTFVCKGLSNLYLVEVCVQCSPHQSA